MSGPVYSDFVTKTQTPQIIHTESVDALPISAAAKAVVGQRWRHVVLLDHAVVTVVVRPAGCGWSMEADCEDADTAAAAIAVVAQNPKGLS